MTTEQNSDRLAGKPTQADWFELGPGCSNSLAEVDWNYSEGVQMIVQSLWDCHLRIWMIYCIAMYIFGPLTKSTIREELGGKALRYILLENCHFVVSQQSAHSFLDTVCIDRKYTNRMMF